MKPLLPLSIALLFLFSSCASLLNPRTMRVNVSSAHPCYLVNNSTYKEVYTDKGYCSYFTGDLIPLKPNHPVLVTVLRDKDPLRMEFIKDSDRSVVEVKSKLSWVYYLNFAAIYPFPGIGFLGDINTPKKWEYDNDVFVDIAHPEHTFTRHISGQPKPEKPEEPDKVVFEKDSPQPEHTSTRKISSQPKPEKQDEPQKVIFEKDSRSRRRS